MNTIFSSVSKKWHILLAVALGVATVPFVFKMITDRMLFYPERGQSRSPAALGLSYDEVWVTAEDGTRTQAWTIPYHGPSEHALPLTLLLFHGNAGTIADRLEFHRVLHDLGVSLFVAEYRGYGDSEGTPSEEGLAQDARAARTAALRFARAHNQDLVIHGRSLGGAVAIRLASEMRHDPVIVESTFTSLSEMAARTVFGFARGLLPYRFASEERIAEIEAPLMIIHGEADELIPVQMGMRLRDLARDAGRNVTFFPVPGGMHNDTWFRGGFAYRRALRSWLAQLPDATR